MTCFNVHFQYCQLRYKTTGLKGSDLIFFYYYFKNGQPRHCPYVLGDSKPGFLLILFLNQGFCSYKIVLIKKDRNKILSQIIMPLFLYFVISHLFASFILPENSFSPGSMLGTAALWFSSLMDVTKFGYLVGSLAALE